MYVIETQSGFELSIAPRALAIRSLGQQTRTANPDSRLEGLWTDSTTEKLMQLFPDELVRSESIKIRVI